MNIKSLLIGSAAALVAVSGARAADAVVAEPEAVEYVKVCDAYGAGFFYIPGTETCLKIGGYVRYQIDFQSDDKATLADEGTHGWRKTAKAMVNLIASSDTELGTLTSYIEMTGKQEAGKTSSGMAVDYAWISLGGLTMGYHDTTYNGDLDGEFDYAGYGDQTHLISYKFSADAVSATLSLEEETNNDNWVPNIVGKLSYSAGDIGADVWAAYDDKDGNGLGTNGANWSVKGRVSAKVGDAGSLKVLALYNSEAYGYYTGGNAAEWAVGASYAHKVSDKLKLTGAVEYLNYYGTKKDGILVAGTADYTIVSGFTARLAATYNASDKVTKGWLRFQRSF